MKQNYAFLGIVFVIFFLFNIYCVKKSKLNLAFDKSKEIISSYKAVFTTHYSNWTDIQFVQIRLHEEIEIQLERSNNFLYC